MINRLKKSNAGFTLIELMICVAIVGILSAIAIPNYISYRVKGADATARSEARNFYTSALAQVADTGVAYSKDSDGLPAGFTANPDVAIVGPFDVTVTGVVMSTVNFQHASSDTLYVLNSDGSIIVYEPPA